MVFEKYIVRPFFLSNNPDYAPAHKLWEAAKKLIKILMIFYLVKELYLYNWGPVTWQPQTENQEHFNRPFSTRELLSFCG